MISSLWACIFSGPEASSVQSTLENDGMTVSTPCFWTAGTYWRSALSQKSWWLISVMPWSIL